MLLKKPAGLKRKVRVGDFVTANLVKNGYSMQGVFTEDNGDGTIWVKTPKKRGKCLCKGPKGVSVVPDKNLSCFPEDIFFLASERRKIIRRYQIILKHREMWEPGH